MIRAIFLITHSEFNNFMNKKTSAFVNSLVLISLALGSSAVEAKRLGGGTSFGSKQSYSAPVQRSALPPSNRVAAPPPASHPAPTYQQPQQQPVNSNSAWKDRAMGAAAGLAVGGLVGSMMGDNHNQAAPIQQNQGYAPQPQPQGYAQPAQPAPQQYAQPVPVQPQQYAQQPAPYYADNTGATRSSGGFGFLGYLLLAGLGYLAYRLFFAKKKPTTPIVNDTSYQRTVNEPAYSAPSMNAGSSADFNTDIMFKKGDSTVSSSTVNLAKSRDFSTPSGFDSAAFLDDVKHRYMDLQRAWDSRDFAEIRGLTTDKVFAEIQAQLKSSNDLNHTEVLTLDADLLEIRELTSEFEAAVLFESTIKESANAQATQVGEVWHFVKSKSGFNSNWMLDGIQQLED
jgi:predicted lipid-binding transport protein (Tim44 family)